MIVEIAFRRAKGQRMQVMDQNCYVCRKPAVLSYDFVVIENSYQAQSTVHQTLTQTTQRIAGIARIPLCKDCLIARVERDIKENTWPNGKPKLMKKKFVDECTGMIQKLQKGDFSKTPELQILFYTTLSPYDDAVSILTKNPLWDCTDIVFGDFAVRRYDHLGAGFVERAPLQVRDRISSLVIDPEYVLLSLSGSTQDNEQSFSPAIVPQLSNSSYSLFFVEYMDQLFDAHKLVDKRTHEQAIELKNYYYTHLKELQL